MLRYAIGFIAGSHDISGKRINGGGKGCDLAGRVGCCFRDLVGKARKALMQSADRIA